MQVINGLIEVSLEKKHKSEIAYSEIYTHPTGYDKTILFLHGLASSKEPMVRTIIQEIYKKAKNSEAKLRIIAIDWPGHGKSGNNLRSYNLCTLTQTIEEIRKAFGIKNFYIYGMSLGGMAAIKFSAENPDTVLGLFIQGTPINGHFWGDAGKLVKRSLGIAKKLRIKAPNSMRFIPIRAKSISNYKKPFWAVGYKNPFFNIRKKDVKVLLKKFNDAEEIILKDMEQLSPRAFLDYAKTIMDAELEPSLVKINETEIPVLIIDGDRPEHIGINTLEYIKRFIPRAETLIVKDAGHLATVIYPETIADKILNFVL